MSDNKMNIEVIESTLKLPEVPTSEVERAIEVNCAEFVQAQERDDARAGRVIDLFQNGTPWPEGERGEDELDLISRIVGMFEPGSELVMRDWTAPDRYIAVTSKGASESDVRFSDAL